MEDGLGEIPLNITVQGDVLIVIYHARSTLGGRLQAKVRDIYTYCLQAEMNECRYNINDQLDCKCIRNGIIMI